MGFDRKEYAVKALGKIPCVFDSETDPFYLDRVPKPFTCGFYRIDTGDYEDWWGPDCIDRFVAHILELAASGLKLCVFVHNLGGFDAHMGLLKHITPGTMPSIINGRLAAFDIGGVEFRDSYRLFPMPLRDYQKDEFDYAKLEADVREQYRDEILLYQRHDCVYLADLVAGFLALFGNRPTIGNTSINYLQNFHGFERMGRGQDAACRPFFYGGRCQVFRRGVMYGAWKVYDVNKMYMSVMRDFKHPLSAQPQFGRGVHSRTAFVDWEGENNGLMCTRAKDGSLDFTATKGRFFSTIHEYRLGLEEGWIKPRFIWKTLGFEEWGDFSDFIAFVTEKIYEAKAAGDKQGELFWKFVGNSAYGKFAQDPANYESYRISMGPEGLPDADAFYHAIERPDGWAPKFATDDYTIWGSPSRNRFSGYFNVATGASITGAARSQLFRGIRTTKGLAYCDTDSLICESAAGIDLDDKRLGAWKLEAEGDVFACAGKKLYALFSRLPDKALKERWDSTSPPHVRPTSIDGVDFYCIKKASKGAVLTSTEILRVAMGEKIRYKSDRPNFKLDGSVEFIERDIEATG